MCGIIGVAGVADASRVAYLGLYSLQHRGQESAGVVAVDGARVPRSPPRHALLSARVGGTALTALRRDAGRFRPVGRGKPRGGSVRPAGAGPLCVIGARAGRGLAPGEFWRIQGSPPEVDKLPSLPAKPHQRCIFELVYFSRPDSTIFGRSVDRVRRALGRELAREHPAPDADCVFSVPDSSNAMALGFAEESG